MSTEKKFDHQYHTQVHEQHLDVFGHVNNAQYLNLYEEARWDFITNNGYGLKDVLEKKKGPVVLEANIRYKRELLNREKIVIYIKTRKLRGKIMILDQWIEKEDGQIASEATFTAGYMDMKARKLIDFDEAWLAAIGHPEQED